MPKNIVLGCDGTDNEVTGNATKSFVTFECGPSAASVNSASGCSSVA